MTENHDRLLRTTGILLLSQLAIEDQQSAIVITSHVKQAKHILHNLLLFHLLVNKPLKMTLRRIVIFIQGKCIQIVD